MQTSEQWWNTIKNDSVKLLNWLKNQYHGEVTASARIQAFNDKFATKALDKHTLTTIAAQEKRHAQWIGELLEARGITPQKLTKEERYWNQTLPAIKNFQTGAAVGAHAETMRLERIRVIAADTEAPKDIREVFTKILVEEVFHAQAFTNMAGPKALKATASAHQHGLNALGLTI